MQLPSKIYETALDEVIRSSFNIDEYEFECSEGSNKGDNFLGVIYRVRVKAKSKKFNIIVKLPPQNARREHCNSRFLFLRESEFYENVCAIYRAFQLAKGVKIETEGLFEVPHCYKSMTVEPYEALFLEDLSEKGFGVANRKESFSKEQVILVIKTLAKMHALFYSIKDQQRESVEKYFALSDAFSKSFSGKNSISNAWVRTQINLALTLVEKQEESDFKRRVLSVLNRDYFEQFNELVNGQSAEPFAVLCHGDCWNNNIMFLNDEGGNSVDTRLLDYQIIRYASPICDFSHCIFTCTSKSLRDKFYQHFVDVYYDTLSDFMSRLGSDHRKLFPRDAFERQLKQFSKFGLLMAILIVPSCTSDPEDVPDLDEIYQKSEKSSDYVNSKANPFNYTSKSTISLYEERMLGVFHDVYDLGYI